MVSTILQKSNNVSTNSLTDDARELPRNSTLFEHFKACQLGDLNINTRIITIFLYFSRINLESSCVTAFEQYMYVSSK